MCGIIGYIGGREVVGVLLDGLKRLEYRGYDSAGVAVLDEGQLQVCKTAGKIANLERVVSEKEPAGHTGIGHTRWATHGFPSDVNAHPHLDCSGGIAVVHNGIIDNYFRLRERLVAGGHKFRSQTDTEVIPHLIETFYRGDLLEAVCRGLCEVEGSYAIAVLCSAEPGRIVIARRHSPMIIGLGEEENWIASDVPAILPYTQRVQIMEDGDIGEVSDSQATVRSLRGKLIQRPELEIQWDLQQAAKGGFQHFMLKEIHDQPAGLRETIGSRLRSRGTTIDLSEANLSDARVRQINRVIMIACGTAYHASLVGKMAIESLARIPVEADVASELRYRAPIIDEHTLAIAVSQSGETADTLAALRNAKEKGAWVLTCTNVVGSSAAREAHGVVYTYAGPEIAVASTKAYTSQVALLCLLAIHIAKVRGTLSARRERQLLRAIRRLPEQAAEILKRANLVEDCTEHYQFCRDFLYLGRGPNLASALEGALKLKEISYLHAEGYPAGEMKHGPIALITPQVASVAIALGKSTYSKLLGNLQEVRARQGRVIAIAFDDDEEIARYADHVLRVPETEEILSPILAAIPLQLFAYYCAARLGCDIDQPRNLAKSVTVE